MTACGDRVCERERGEGHECEKYAYACVLRERWSLFYRQNEHDRARRQWQRGKPSAGSGTPPPTDQTRYTDECGSDEDADDRQRTSREISMHTITIKVIAVAFLDVPPDLAPA